MEEEREREREINKDLPSVASLNKWSQVPVLGQTEARNLTTFGSSTQVSVAFVFEPPSTAFPGSLLNWCSVRDTDVTGGCLSLCATTLSPGDNFNLEDSSFSKKGALFTALSKDKSRQKRSSY